MNKLAFYEEKLAKTLMYLSVLVVVYCVVSVIGAILQRGLPVLSWQMVSEVPGGGFFIGGKGGFLNAIVGSLYIVGGSTILLFGIPSIVYGAFAFTLMVAVGMRASLLGGIVVVTIMIVPMLIRSMDEVAKNIPHGLLESSYSLGSTRIETIGIVLRQIAPAIATATLLSIGRAIGDCAGVMFTAGFSDHIPTSLSQQAATLPLCVFYQLTAPQQSVQDRAYAAAVVLTLIVLVLSLGGRLIMSHFNKNKV